MSFQTFAGKWLTGFVLGFAFLSANSSGGVLESLPNTSELVGQQTDRSSNPQPPDTTAPFSETISLGGPVKITSFTWWGYDLGGSPDPGDIFLISGSLTGGPDKVSVNPVKQLITVKDAVNGDVDVFVIEYTLDFSSPVVFAGGALTVFLTNDSDDVAWFWQGAGPTDDDARAYRIVWDPLDQNVPEPGMLALFGLALAGLGFVRARRRLR